MPKLTDDQWNRIRHFAEENRKKAGKGVKIMAIVDRCGLPLSIGAHSAQRHRGQDRAQLSLDRVLLDDPARNLVGDKAYDSNPLDAEAGERGVEMIAPHRRNRTRPKTRDGRRLRRYKRRWIVERFFAWIQWNRGVLVRWEYNPENFLGFVQLAAPCLPLKLEIGSSRRGQWSPRFSRNREQLQE